MYSKFTTALVLTLAASSGAHALDLENVLKTVQLPGTQVESWNDTTSTTTNTNASGMPVIGHALGASGISTGSLADVSLAGVNLVSSSSVTPLLNATVLGKTTDQRQVIIDVKLGQGKFISLDDLLGSGGVTTLGGRLGGTNPLGGGLPAATGLLGGSDPLSGITTAVSSVLGSVHGNAPATGAGGLLAGAGSIGSVGGVTGSVGSAVGGLAGSVGGLAGSLGGATAGGLVSGMASK